MGLAMRWLIVVARGQPVVYKHIRRDHFGDQGITVIRDRRRTQRRQRRESHFPDRRRAERRCHDIATDLWAQGWAEIRLPEDWPVHEAVTIETRDSGPPMNLADELDHFLAVHRAHGRLSPTVGKETPNGNRLAIACPCGVTFERWVTPPDALEDLLRARLRAERN